MAVFKRRQRPESSRSEYEEQEAQPVPAENAGLAGDTARCLAEIDKVLSTH